MDGLLLLIVVVALSVASLVWGWSALQHVLTRWRARMSSEALELRHDLSFDPAQYAALSHDIRSEELSGDKTLIRLKALEQSPQADRITQLAAILDVVEASQRQALTHACEWTQEDLLTRAYALEQQGPVPPELRATRLRLLSYVHVDREGYRQGEKLLRQAIAIHEENNATLSRNYIIASATLGLLYYKQHRYSSALPLLRRAYYAYCTARALSPVTAAQCLEFFVYMHSLNDRWERALSLLREVESLYAQSLSKDHLRRQNISDFVKLLQPWLRKRRAEQQSARAA